MTSTQAPRNPGRSYTFKQWAERRGLTPPEAMQLVNDGYIVTYKAAGKRFVTEESDLAFIQAAESETADADLEPAARDLGDLSVDIIAAIQIYPEAIDPQGFRLGHALGFGRGHDAGREYQRNR